MKIPLLLLTLIISLKAYSICSLDVYVRPAKSFDAGHEATMTFAKGKELNAKHNSTNYIEDKLYGYYIQQGHTVYYEFEVQDDCGDEVYEICINQLPSMLKAIGQDGKVWKVIVYK